jgi:5'-methylthioadenosine phosphorylase
MPDKVRTNIEPVGIIGGTGFYAMELEEQQSLCVETPFGTCNASSGLVNGRKVVFVARHGTKHSFLPHEVNYHANIYGLKKLGVKRVFAFCMAGTLNKSLSPGGIVIPDQFIDLTHGRENTFFGKGNSAYVSMAEPFCNELSSFTVKELSAMGATVHQGGTYVCVQGPHFSTRAESKLYSGFGDLVGMTAATEAKLAREAGLCYIVIASVVDYDTCGMGMKDMRKVLQTARQAARSFAEHAPSYKSCKCAHSLAGHVVNKDDSFDPALIEGKTSTMFHH